MESAANKSYVAFIVPDIYPCTTGGMEIYYFNLIKELTKKERVLLITVCHEFNEPDVEVIRVKKKFLRIPGSGRFFLPLKIFFTLIKYHKKIRLIHFPYTSNAGKWGYVLSLSKKLFNLKYILQIHGGGMREWKPLSGNKLLFKHASELIAVSDLIKNEYEKRTSRELKLIYPLVPFVRAVKEKGEIKKIKGLSDNDKIILFVGSLKKLKSPDTLLKAFGALGIDYIKKENLKLIFVGKGELRQSLENEISLLGLNENVIITGLIPYEEVPLFFKIADIYVMPSKYEGTPKSLLEAMFNKLPIIASDVSGINNVLTDNQNALLFTENNSDELSTKIRRIISDKQLTHKLSENANKHYIAKYSFDKTLTNLLEIYNSY